MQNILRKIINSCVIKISTTICNETETFHSVPIHISNTNKIIDENKYNRINMYKRFNLELQI